MGVDAMMFVGVKRAMEPREINRLSADMVEAFGDQFNIYRPGNEYRDEPRHALSDVKTSPYYEADDIGDCFKRNDVAQWLEVNLFGRYYGEGYERGDFPFLYALAKWLDARLPGCVILYGGDSDDRYEPFDAKRREELFAHFAKNGHRPYRGGFGRFTGDTSRPVCEFCAGTPMTNYGGGRGDTFYSCDGCGYKGIMTGGELKEIEGEFFDRKFKVPATP
jgi:hypothetical protein